MDFKSLRDFVVFTISACIIFFLSVSIREVEGGKKCPGRCMANVTDCKAKGGKIAGYCTNELPCCDYTYMKIGSCGANKSKLTTAIFRSPDYPYLSSGDLTCPFEFIFSPNATGLLVEFTHVIMDGSGFVKDSPCESDMFFFKGFPDWTPPAQCGNLTNYVATIDLGGELTKGMQSLKILAIMSSDKYRWSIKITQVMKKKKPVMMTTTTPPSPPIGNPDDDVDHFPGDHEKVLLPPDDENMEHSGDAEIASILSRYSHLTKAQFQSDSLWSGEDTDSDLEEEPFIVNGDLTDISKTPWQASLRSILDPRLANKLSDYKLKNCTLKEGIHFCGGTVISDRHILSAAHCFYMGRDKSRTWQNLYKMKIVLGDSNLCDENTDGIQEFKAEKVYYHYAYDHHVIMHDIVVIKTDRKIKFSDKVQSVKMAKEGITLDHIEALASGWGLTNLTIGDEASTPDQLRSAQDMFIGNKSECLKEQLKLYPTMGEDVGKKFSKYRNVFDSLICSYVRNATIPRVVGQGDSGGPLVVKLSNGGNTEHTNEEPTLIGVVSYMIPIRSEEETHDVSNYVDFYQSVSFYRKWIDLTMDQ